MIGDSTSRISRFGSTVIEVAGNECGVLLTYTPGSNFAAVVQLSWGLPGHVCKSSSIALAPHQLRALALRLVEAATLIEAPL